MALYDRIDAEFAQRRWPAGTPGGLGGRFMPAEGEDEPPGGPPHGPRDRTPYRAEIEPAHLELASQIIGRPVTADNLCRLAGALPGARVESRRESRTGHLVLTVVGEGGAYTAERVLHEGPPPWVYNRSFDVQSPRYYDRGFGTAMLVTQAGEGVALGLSHVKTLASGQGDGTLRPLTAGGFYAWARLGYNARLTNEMVARLKQPYSDVEDLHSLFAMKGGPEEWRRRGVGFAGVFDLREGSRSRALLRAYAAAKGTKVSFGTEGGDGILSPEDEEIMAGIWERIQREGWGALPPPQHPPAGDVAGGPPAVSPPPEGEPPSRHTLFSDGGVWDGGPIGGGRTFPVPQVVSPPPDALAVCRHLLGRDYDPADVARLAGTPDEGSASFFADGPDKLKVRGSGGGYSGAVTVSRDDDGVLRIHSDERNLSQVGHGLTTRSLVAQVQAGVRLGARSLDAKVGSDQDGHNDMARLGFDGTVPDAVRGRLPESLRPFKRVLDVLHAPGGITAWREHGGPYDGRFDLTPGSRSLHILSDYLNERKLGGLTFGASPPTPSYGMDWEEEQALRKVWQRRNPDGERPEVSPDAPPPADAQAVEWRPVDATDAQPSVWLSAADETQHLLFLLGDGVVTPATFSLAFGAILAEALHGSHQDTASFGDFLSLQESLFSRLDALDAVAEVPEWAALFLAAAQSPDFPFRRWARERVDAAVFPATFSDDDRRRLAELASAAAAFSAAGPFEVESTARSVFVSTPDATVALLTPAEFKWVEERGPRGGRRWVNETGTLTYKEPKGLDKEEQEQGPSSGNRQAAAQAVRGVAQKPEPPSPVRQDPSGQPRATKKQMAAQADRQGATDRSRDLASRIRTVVTAGKFNENHLSSVRTAVGKLSHGEAQHVFRSLVEGGHSSDHAADAGEKLAQALRKHKNYDVAQADQQIREKISGYTDGDRHVQGILRFAQSQSPLRAAFASAVSAVRGAVGMILRLPPRGSGDEDQTSRQDRQVATQRIQEQGDLAAKNLSEIRGANNRAREALVRMIGTDRPVNLQSTVQPGLPPKVAAAAQDALAFFSRVLALKHGESGAPHVTITAVKSGRAAHVSTGPGTSTITLPPHADAAVVVHEIAHAVERHVPGIRDACNRFLAARCRGESPTDMGKVNPGLAGEMGRKDQFDRVFPKDRAYYVGKSYAKGTTEILSMGLEQLYRDPVGMARKDPEFTKFLVGILKGDLR